jgi:L-lactate dehydrogenase
LEAAGLDAGKAEAVAEIAVEADLMGHDTHGVSMIPTYVGDIRAGLMQGSGTYDVLGDLGACFTWNGNRLPGHWLIRQALDQACCRAGELGVVTGVINNSQHTGALATYLRPVTEQGLVVIIQSSNPAGSRMAPFGGTEPLFTPNPLAAGFPTDGDPVMVDISCSITTTTMTRTLAARGERFPEPWAITAAGAPTDDPVEVVSRDGSLLPLGGPLKGHKGYGLALVVELLTQGLSGYGRADSPTGTAQSLFVQVLDPAAFGGREAFLRQSSWIADACRANRPPVGGPPVRLPGEKAAKLRRQALAEGVPVSVETIAALKVLASELGVAEID